VEGDGDAAIMSGALGDANLGTEKGNGQGIGKGDKGDEDGAASLNCRPGIIQCTQLWIYGGWIGRPRS